MRYLPLCQRYWIWEHQLKSTLNLLQCYSVHLELRDTSVLMVCLYVFTGLSLLKKMTGQICRTCHRFFVNVEDAKTHCRTLVHYNNFVALVKEKVTDSTHSLTPWSRDKKLIVPLLVEFPIFGEMKGSLSYSQEPLIPTSLYLEPGDFCPKLYTLFL
jgi:hypothetical protein